MGAEWGKAVLEDEWAAAADGSKQILWIKILHINRGVPGSRNRIPPALPARFTAVSITVDLII
jgi:hypothetical protein